MRFSKRVATAVAIMGAVAILSPGTAHATTGGAAVAVVGNGTISPGLSEQPREQTVQFTGTAAGAAFAVSPTVADGGAVTCSFNGNSGGPLKDETSAAGTGTVTGGCSGTGVLGNSVNASCNLDYARTGPVVVVTGNCTIDGGGAHVATSVTAGVFVFVPGPSLPTQTYTLVGVAAGAGAN